MRILIIQLARLGDIYMSWPLLRALKRTYPEAQVDMLTRDKFKGAVEGLNELDQHHLLNTEEIVSPVVRNGDLQGSLSLLDQVLKSVKDCQYDVILNLTFSPVSSCITQALATEQTQILGYSRHTDDSLALLDDVSTYFYAQGGIGNNSRIHVSDVFAAMVGLEYVAEDWRGPQITDSLSLPATYAVLHIGASVAHKSLSTSEFFDFVTEFGASSPGVSLVLIGTQKEAEALGLHQANLPEHVVNLCGQTSLAQVFEILSHAEILVGGDSAPIHMAALLDTPCFNISLGAVNPWETGPKSSLGFIYRPAGNVYGAEAARCVSELLAGRVPEGLMMRTGGSVSYEVLETPEQRFQWELVQALYFGSAYPITDSLDTVRAAQQLYELSSFIEAQIAHAQKVGLQTVAPLIEQAEELVFNISRICPQISPMVNWYLGQKVRIPPGSLQEIISATLTVHQDFRQHLAAYCPDEGLFKDEVYDGTL